MLRQVADVGHPTEVFEVTSEPFEVLTRGLGQDDGRDDGQVVLAVVSCSKSETQGWSRKITGGRSGRVEGGDGIGWWARSWAMKDQRAASGTHGPMDQGLSIEIDVTRDELELVDELLVLDGKDILELGCGAAEKTRAIAEGGTGRRVLALEVDETQHQLNLDSVDIQNVRFELGAAEEIPATDRSCDVVLLFKSLHHVPVDRMDGALAEIVRVLRPGGHAYISEPIFRGEFNEVLRIFHDESRVREEAFRAIERAVDSGALELVSQTFFLSPVYFANFDQFDQNVIGVTHSNHVLTDERRQRVRETFAGYEGQDGVHLEQPVRVDLLRRPRDQPR